MKRVAIALVMWTCGTLVDFGFQVTEARAGTIVGTKQSANAFPFGNPDSTKLNEYQQVYSASAFTGPISIDSISFFSIPNRSPFEDSTFQIMLSTTQKSVNGLSTQNLNSNIGADTSLFGTYSLSGASPSILTFTGTSFNYNPADGNLLLDVEFLTHGQTTQVFAPAFDADNSGLVTSRAYQFSSTTIYNIQADRTGLVTEFGGTASVPEPSSIALLSLGGICLGVCVYRHKRAIAA